MQLSFRLFTVGPLRRARISALALLAGVWHAAAIAPAAEPIATAELVARHQITGLFSPDRIDDLRRVMEEIPDIQLLAADFTTAEATFIYDPAVAFANVKPQEVSQRFDQILRQASNHTFGVKPLCITPPERLLRVEISVAGLDCKACSFGAYEAIYRLPGVERATASFREGRVTAVIDRERTSRTELEMALKQRGVDVKP